MSSNNCNIDDIWDAFHYSAIIFYGAYGLLCCFAPELYGKHVYFRNKWNDEIHSKDEIFWYFVIGAGECCIHMALMNLFVYKFGKPDGNQSDDISNWIEAYLIIQILSWIKWTLTEAYYTYKEVEWVTIGYVHITLCLGVLGMAIGNYYEVKDKCL